MPRFAANLSTMFTELGFLDRFAAAEAAGFDAIELQFPYDYPAYEVAKRLAAHGLEPVLINLPPGDLAGGERGLAALPGRQADFAQAVEAGLDYALAIGCRTVHCLAGLVLSDRGADEACERCYIANLRHAAWRAAERGVTLVIEPINRRDMPHYFLSTPEQARPIIAAVGAPNLGLQFDCYHAQIMGGDLTARLKSHADLIRHIQIACVPDRAEPDRGEIHYPHLFEVIDGMGYHGWIGCEYRPRRGTLDGLGWARTWLSAAGASGANLTKT
jgi:2-dehydrotetronate isomerase